MDATGTSSVTPDSNQEPPNLLACIPPIPPFLPFEGSRNHCGFPFRLYWKIAVDRTTRQQQPYEAPHLPFYFESFPVSRCTGHELLLILEKRSATRRLWPWAAARDPELHHMLLRWPANTCWTPSNSESIKTATTIVKHDYGPESSDEAGKYSNEKRSDVLFRSLVLML